MASKKTATEQATTLKQEVDELYRQMMESPHGSGELQRQLMNYKKEQWVRDQMRGIAPSQLPHHNHRWQQWHDQRADPNYVDKLERELRDARRELEELRAPQVGPDLLTPMRQMAAKFDLLEKSLDDAPHTPNVMWNELFSRKGRFFVYEYALKENPRLMLSIMCGVFPLRTEYAYECGAFDITGVSLYFRPIGPHDQIPRYELEFTTNAEDPQKIAFRWKT